MCLIIFAYRCSEQTPLALAANRDEYHARPTQSAHFWRDREDLLAGRDLQAGGTWLGITRAGRFAAITNFRDPARTRPAPRSRGELTLNYLCGEISPRDYVDSIAPLGEDFAGFNLLLGDTRELWYCSNSGGGARRLDPGIYGLSNALLDTPWPKVVLGREAMRRTLEGPLSHAALAAVIADRRVAAGEDLALRGLEEEMARALSAQFIVAPEYGTRSTTTLWLSRSGGASLREVSYTARGEAAGSVEENFRLAPPVNPPARG